MKLKDYKHMKLSIFCITEIIFLLLGSLSFADDRAWEVCKRYHDGNIAKDIKNRYEKADELIEAAKMSTSPLMSPYRNNEKLLKDAAKELDLK